MPILKNGDIIPVRWKMRNVDDYYGPVLFPIGVAQKKVAE
jgi:hypothetical protein